MVFMAALVILFGVSMLLCYVMWVQQGCTWFMPFVSDFGVSKAGRTGPYFAIGTSVGGFLLGVAIVMQNSIERKRQEGTGCLAKVRLFGGILFALSLCGVGLNPCDTHPFGHGMSANTCFISGFVYSIFTCLIYKQEGKQWTWIAAFVLVSIALMLSMQRAQNAMLQETLSPLYPNDPSYASFDKFNPMTHENYRYWCSGSQGLNGSNAVTMVPCPDPFSRFNCPLTGPGPHSVLIGNIAALLEWSLLLVNAFPCVYSLLAELDGVKAREAMPSHPLLMH